MNDEFPTELSEMDLTAFLNLRDWLEKAVEDAGAHVTDAGIGFGAADIGIKLDGMPYGITIKPRKAQ